MDKCNWAGHEFGVYEYTSTWSKDCGGIYIFCALNAQRQWVPLYIGQCDCFCDRLTTHDRWEEAQQRGAVRVHALTMAQAAKRDALEAQLIQAYQPPLNTMLK